MANYYGKTRSNYFKVKDIDMYIEICNDFELDIIKSDGRVGFIVNNETGDIPYSDHVNDILEFDKYPDGWGGKFIVDLLEDEEVMIVMSIGSEKYRYFQANATAYNNKGQIIDLNINEIYDKISSLGTNISRCEF